MKGQKRGDMLQRMGEADEQTGKRGPAMTTPPGSVGRLATLFATVWGNARVALAHADRLLTTTPMCVLLTTHSLRRASMHQRCTCASCPQGMTGVCPHVAPRPAEQMDEIPFPDSLNKRNPGIHG